MTQLPRLPDAAFRKADPSPDDAFYVSPRFVTHIDDAAIAAVTRCYRAILPAGGALLDLMSSWVSHLPEDVAHASVIGHGMNAAELAANPRLSRWFVQDLNRDPSLPLPDASLDGACQCVSIQYLQRPVDVLRELRRCLRPGAPFVASFSNRCFPTKAVAIWQALTGEQQQGLVGAYLREAGFAEVTTDAFLPARGDPLRIVIGRAPAKEGVLF